MHIKYTYNTEQEEWSYTWKYTRNVRRLHLVNIKEELLELHWLLICVTDQYSSDFVL